MLVVAADDGVMPQTEEAISHARAAGVPIVVALNKIDLPGVNIERIFQQLAANELLPSEWGGETEVVKTSATTGEGIDDLLETLLTVAELHEYRANPDRPARGTCLESEMHEGRGVVAKLLVQNGHAPRGRRGGLRRGLRPRQGDVRYARSARAARGGRALHAGQRHRPERGPRRRRPLLRAGRHLPGPRPGRAAGRRQPPEANWAAAASTSPWKTSSSGSASGSQVQTLNIILRADVRGSIEAIRKELGKLQHPEVQIKILQATVGGITEADVHLADASDAVIIGFNVVADEAARLLADQRGVQIRRYDIIYQVTEDLRAALEGMLKPGETREGAGPGPGAAGVPHQPRGHRGRLPRAVRHDRPRLPASA